MVIQQRFEEPWNLVRFQELVPVQLRYSVIGNTTGFDPVILGSSPSTSTKCEGGETGRRTGFKPRRR